MFKWFRRNQKILLAIAGVLIMIVFVLGDAMQGWMTRGASTSDPVVVSTIYGDITESQLARMRQSRDLANRFAGRFIGHPQVYGPTTDQALVQRYVLANKAAQLGFVVTDEQVTDQIRDMTGDQVAGSDLARFLKEDIRANEPQLFSALRTELQSRWLQVAFLPQLGASTPGERFEYFQRLNGTATIEAIATPAANFIDKVADPSPDELAAFFAGAKDVEPQRGSPAPGFRIPHKVDLQYIVAEYEKFVDPAAVTDAEVEAFYNKRKEEFRWSEMNFPIPPTTSAGETSPAETPPAEAPAEGATPGEPPAEGEPSAADAPANPPAVPEAVPTDETESPAADSAAPATGSSEQPSDENACGVAFQEPSGDQPPADPASAETPSEPTLNAPDQSTDTPSDAAPAAEASTAVEAPATEAADKQAADKDAADEKDETAPDKAPFAPSSPLETDDFPLPRDINAPPNPEYDPLWKVADSIRRVIAVERANARIMKALEPLRQQMRNYDSARTQWLAKRDADPNTTAREPQMPDFKALAEQQGMRLESTGLVTAQELVETPGIGEAYVVEVLSSGERQETESVIRFAFTRPTTYLPKIAVDLQQNHYLFWKTEDSPARTPEFDDVRDEVVRAWKMINARELAEAQARQLADEARNKKLSLKELAAERGLTAVETSPFSWLTRPPFAGMDGSESRPTLTEVKGIEDAGNDFMRVVFGLEVGDVGVAFNNPQTTAYVVRVTSAAPSRALLRSMFITANFDTYEAAGALEQYEYTKAWIDGLEEEARVEWKRDADADRRG